MSLKSAIYTGRVRHRRFKPTGNAFSYAVCLFYLDLAEIPRIFRFPGIAALNAPGLVAFRRRDYLGDPNRPLDECVRDVVEKQAGRRPTGPIRLLTQISYFGYCFNPVSFYYCFDPKGERVEFILTEITNTPWHERHSYVLPCEGRAMEDFSFKKEFHVSPFIDMNQGYRWFFSAPRERIFVHMENVPTGAPGRFFDATLNLDRSPLTFGRLMGALALYPLMTFKTVAMIYFQAFKLWMKRVPFHSHPSKGVAS